jgi:ubiquinone/menaquinone biosynthesis C-methylase UbiE
VVRRGAVFRERPIVNRLANYYQQYDEDARLGKSRTRELEFQMTIEALAPCLKRKSRIADVGAGTGRYSFHFSRMGHAVTAVEPVPKHLDILEQRKRELSDDKIEILKGDARQLRSLGDRTFDLVLCLGPIYHLRKPADRAKCLSECRRIVKRNGHVAVAYINKHYAVSTYFKNRIDLGRKIISRIIAEDFRFTSNRDRFLDVSYFCSPTSMERQLTSAGFTIVDHLGLDGPFNLIEDKIEQMTRQQLAQFHQYHRATCRDASILGYSNHGLVICQRPEGTVKGRP